MRCITRSWIRKPLSASSLNSHSLPRASNFFSATPALQQTHPTTPTPSPSQIKETKFRETIERYARRAQSPVSIIQFTAFSRGAHDVQVALSSSDFLFNTELPTRVAHMIKIIEKMPGGLQYMPAVQKTKEWYLQTMRDALAFQEYFSAEATKNPADVVQRSLELCTTILQRHAAVVPTLAAGLFQLNQACRTEEIPSYERFLDCLYLSRIGTRMLQSQHLELFSAFHDKRITTPEKDKSCQSGVFDEKLDLKKLVEEAAANARFLCAQKYGEAPEVEIEAHIRNSKRAHRIDNKDETIIFSYVPSHLYHILFELLKNSIRAVVEFHSERPSLPPVRVILVKGEHDLTIKIEDQGGGVPLASLPKLFSYSYSTAPKPDIQDISFDMNHAPLAGFGYGIPMSRLYARYFGGDLRILSTEGYGMDSLVYLKVLAADAKETLPVVDQEDEGEYLLTREEVMQASFSLRKENQKLKEKFEKVQDVLKDD